MEKEILFKDITSMEGTDVKVITVFLSDGTMLYTPYFDVTSIGIKGIFYTDNQIEWL